MLGERSNNIIINISHDKVMRADSWGGIKSLSPFVSRELGWLTLPQVGGTWYVKYILKQKQKRKQKIGSE